jgi:two-component system, chemotaxis family, chemotaxis protein CheY
MDILVVDDSKTMRLIVQRAIRMAGYRSLQVAEADNVAQALEKLRDAQPRLILSDWNMPEMSGLDLLKQVRETDKKTAFGFITSERSAETRVLAMAEGATFMLSKPFTPDDIRDALEPILG